MVDQTTLRNLLARAIHEHYRQNQHKPGISEETTVPPWEKLAEDLRESNRQQADHIPVKLQAIGCSYRPIGDGSTAAVAFKDYEVEIMARLEHERWMAERRHAGWVYGEQRDPNRKISPYLVPYDELPEEAKERDREAVRAIPEVLAQAQLEVWRS